MPNYFKIRMDLNRNAWIMLCSVLKMTVSYKKKKKCVAYGFGITRILF